MASDTQLIDFDEFAAHLPQVFEQLETNHRPILVKRDGALYRLEEQNPDRVRRGIRQMAGAFAGIDTRQLLKDLHIQREQGSGRSE